VFSEATTATLREMLASVVDSGTATPARVPGLHIGGKTGTAQKFDPQLRAYSSHKYLASFIGVAPARDPRLVVLVMIDEPKGAIYGGSVAAPVFKKVVQRTLRYLNVPPEASEQVLLVRAYPGAGE
jgi:cell division protein FtsI (penicillin-binding protein 3)